MKNLAEVVDEALAANGLKPEEIDWLVPHQANQRIINGIAKKLHLPPERVIMTIENHANTSAASIPLALAEAVKDGKIKPGNWCCSMRWAVVSLGLRRWLDGKVFLTEVFMDVILVIDDHDMLRKTVVGLLTSKGYTEDNGYKIVEATTLDEANRKYHENRSDVRLAITDLGYPESAGSSVKPSGFKFIQSIRTQDFALPIILMTANLDDLGVAEKELKSSRGACGCERRRR